MIFNLNGKGQRLPTHEGLPMAWEWEFCSWSCFNFYVENHHPLQEFNSECFECHCNKMAMSVLEAIMTLLKLASPYSAWLEVSDWRKAVTTCMPRINDWSFLPLKSHPPNLPLIGHSVEFLHSTAAQRSWWRQDLPQNLHFDLMVREGRSNKQRFARGTWQKIITGSRMMGT